ncbi:MAG: putative bifunctional diguanylate cyclase/phosphodiesterase [Steroidobacteraceae bacterium]
MPFILRSFHFRILALVLILVTAVALAMTSAVVIKAHGEVGGQAASKLESAAATAREVLRFRGDQLSSASDVLTSDFGFKEAIASGDRQTLKSAMDNHRSRIGADVLIVLDRDGRVVDSTQPTLSSQTHADLEDLVSSDADSALLRLYRLINGHPYQLVISPVLAPDPIGWTAIGFALDDKVATDMARLLGVQVSFVAQEGASYFVASSLPQELRPAFVDVAKLASDSPSLVQTNNDSVMTWAHTIRSGNGGLRLVLQESIDSALRPYLQLRRSMIEIGLAVLAFALAFAALLSRSATRPLDDLTRAAARLEAGDYSTPVPSASTHEISRVAAAFNAMRGAVAERERVIRHQAVHDPLTDLLTRVGITEQLDQAIENARRNAMPVSGCIIHLQQFHDIVGSYGHAAADLALIEVAHRLISHIGGSDRVARIGTDEFLLILEGVDADQALAAAQEVNEKLQVPFEYQGVSLQLETRIGVAVFPDDGETAADLLRRADLALFRAGETGLSVGRYVAGDDQTQRHRLAVLGDLRRAIAANELELHFQPKIALPLDTVSGCEALVRWRHPTKGLIPPNDFIVYAERTGMICALTAWVLEAAFRHQRRWQEGGTPLDMAINISAADLADPAFTDSVVSLLRKTGADPSRIVLEVTESGAMKDLQHTRRIMEELRVLGIRFSIDDFGTGYSSLAHLRSLPVDEIKIDRSFVRELDRENADDVILRSTINLGHAMNLKVVAEGVETVAALQALAHFGCDLVQGYFISKPLPEAMFDQWLVNRSAVAVAGAAPTAVIHDRRLLGT